MAATIKINENDDATLIAKLQQQFPSMFNEDSKTFIFGLLSASEGLKDLIRETTGNEIIHPREGLASHLTVEARPDGHVDVRAGGKKIFQQLSPSEQEVASQFNTRPEDGVASIDGQNVLLDERVVAPRVGDYGYVMRPEIANYSLTVESDTTEGAHEVNLVLSDARDFEDYRGKAVVEGDNIIIKDLPLREIVNSDMRGETAPRVENNDLDVAATIVNGFIAVGVQLGCERLIIPKPRDLEATPRVAQQMKELYEQTRSPGKAVIEQMFGPIGYRRDFTPVAEYVLRDIYAYTVPPTSRGLMDALTDDPWIVNLPKAYPND